MEHTAKHTNTSNVNPIILTMDDHESHVSVDTMEYAKEHGVQAMTLPPHTSHKTQPLDRSVFGPLKNYFNGEANSWMMRNPGKPLIRYQIAQLVGAAMTKAACPTYITSSFKASAIWPFNQDVFEDDQFLPASITDWPAQNQQMDDGQVPGQSTSTDHPSTLDETSE